MSKLQKLFIHYALVSVICVFSTVSVHAQMAVVGNWEAFDPNSPGGGGNFNSDGWITWGADPTFNNQHGHPVSDSTAIAAYFAANPSASYPQSFSSSTTTGVTLGSQSLEVLPGTTYSQNIALKTEFTTGDNAAFFANQAFAIDVTYPSYTATQNANGGYQQIYQVFLNAGGGYGFNTLANPASQVGVGFAPNLPSAASTHTLRVDYADQLSMIPNPTYAEFILATVTDSVTNHGAFFFDNARFYTPGDMNNDGHVNAADIPAMELALTNPTAYKNTYWAGNPNYTDADRILIGDMNGAGYNGSNGLPQPPGVHLVGDGSFDNSDLAYLLQYLNAGAGSTSTVPEPASITLLVIAGPGLWLAARRKRAHKRLIRHA